jgi:hypothetical protein
MSGDIGSLDIRVPIGALFGILGLILVVYGVATNGDVTQYAPAGGININLWWGAVMLAFGLILLAMSRTRSAARSRRAPSAAPRAPPARPRAPHSGAPGASRPSGGRRPGPWSGPPRALACGARAAPPVGAPAGAAAARHATRSP